MKRFTEYLIESSENYQEKVQDTVDNHELEKMIASWRSKMRTIEDDYHSYEDKSDQNEDFAKQQQVFRKNFLDLIHKDHIVNNPNKRLTLIDRMLHEDPTLMLEPNIPFDELSSMAELRMVADPSIAIEKPYVYNLPKYYNARKDIEEGKVMTPHNPNTGKLFTFDEIQKMSDEDKQKIKNFEKMERALGGEHNETGQPLYNWIGPDRVPSAVMKRKHENTLGQHIKPHFPSIG